MPRETISAKTCRSCGVCCVAPGSQNVFCDITKEDAERLGRKFVRLHVLQPSMFDLLATRIDIAIGNHHLLPFGAIKTRWVEQESGPFETYQFNQCVCLEGSLMKKTSCSIYAKRPGTCKTAVKPGDKQCRRLRRVFKDRIKAIQANQRRTSSA